MQQSNNSIISIDQLRQDAELRPSQSNPTLKNLQDAPRYEALKTRLRQTMGWMDALVGTEVTGAAVLTELAKLVSSRRRSRDWGT
jgi:hypothetical protein